MFPDRPATFRSYQTVKEIALVARERGGVAGCKEFNVANYIIDILIPAFGPLIEFKLFSASDSLEKAYVNLNYKTRKIKLNVSKAIWTQGKFGVPEANYILAHEIGHMLMHQHDRLAYSSGSQDILKFLSNEYKAEPQANLFADIFLVYDDLVLDYTSADRIEKDFRVPAACAKRRLNFADDERRNNHRGELLGDPCPNCANMMLFRNRYTTRCKLCDFQCSTLL